MLNALTEKDIELVSEYFNFSPGRENPMALWIIGRPAAGKTTVAKLLHDMLRQSGHRVELIDGDVARSVLNGSIGYSFNDRLRAFQKYVHINQLFQSSGIVPITATIAGFRQFRNIIWNNLNNLNLVYLECPFEVAAERDQKGHYTTAIAGEIEHFFGVDIVYEIPVRYTLKINSARLKPYEIVARILEHLNSEKILNGQI